MLPHRNDLTFPARDESLAPLIARLSEPTRSPAADNFVSNEDSYPRVVAELARRVKPGTVYLGVGPDQNFTLMASSRPSLAFLLDYRRRNLVLHLGHKALFALSADRVAYLRRLTAREPGPLPSDPSAAQLVSAFRRAAFDRERLRASLVDIERVVRPLGVLSDEELRDLATIFSRLAGPGLEARFLALPMYPTLARQVLTLSLDGEPAHLLALESHYQRVRDLHLAERVVPLTADLAGPKGLSALGDWLRERKLSVGVVYVSDVEFFLLRAGRYEAHIGNLKNLPLADGAVLVRTSTREIKHPARASGDSSTTLVIDAREAMQRRVVTPEDLFPTS